ncbi:Estradiol 17-beta-dehydrogenase 1 [Merluccius polli]|uniref:Estradiol 17-beta-dehydrogenase 1 n=1 Tax=Merluccius polli TaxID=89951 RepID=A0AA47MNZ7_MERPO|nr:Estradiol 17-beta-dehydrogenase 1 [Merluccius polli]
MDKKVVLITGCSSGIGLSLAVRLASDPEKTYKVYATMRNLAKKERLLGCVRELHRDTLDILQMDVTNQQSILQARDSVVEKRVDILGVGLMGPLEVQSLDTMRQILEVNLLGTIQTIQAFLPDMKAQCQGRILVTGSIGGLHGLPFNEVYCASKFAIEGACESLAIVLQHFNIHMSLIECGPVNTDFLDNQQKAELGDASLDQVDAATLDLYERYLHHCTAMFHNAAQDTEDIVKVFLSAIQASRPAFRYYTSGALPPLVRLKTSAPEGCRFIRAISQLIFPTDTAEQPP